MRQKDRDTASRRLTASVLSSRLNRFRFASEPDWSRRTSAQTTDSACFLAPPLHQDVQIHASTRGETASGRTITDHGVANSMRTGLSEGTTASKVCWAGGSAVVSSGA